MCIRVSHRAVVQSKEILQWRAQMQAELQNLRIRINRRYHDHQDATDLLNELNQKHQELTTSVFLAISMEKLS